jgi:hypothetical protein
MHAVALRDFLRTAPLDDRTAAAIGWHETTQATVYPYFESTLTFDRHRLAEIEAEIEGKPYDPGDPVYELTNALQAASGKDPDVFRAFMRVVGILDNAPDVLADPAIAEKVVALGAGWRDEPTIAPSRAELLATVAG